jgi:hypothetical protein
MDKFEVLKKLQQIQTDNIGVIDCSIESRKDKQSTQFWFRACNYGQLENNQVDPENRSKLYTHRFKWVEPNCENEFDKIEKEINKLRKYN